MRRIAIVGNSGSGKSTLARSLAQRLGLEHVELDGIYHQPGWTPLPDDEFRARVAPLVAKDSWVVDGNYGVVRELVWSRADTVVWLDLPRRTVAPRILRRTLVRATTRAELWNGNRERWRNLVRLDKHENILLWSISQHEAYRTTYLELLATAPPADTDVVRMRTAGEVRRWLAAVTRERA